MAAKITLNNNQLTENDAGAVVGTLTISGGTSTPLASLSLSDLNGSNGFRFDGVDSNDYSGSVSSAGDVNGDGFADVIIGASKADPDGKTEAGETYVVFGKSSGWGSSLALSSLNGSNGFRLDGVDADDRSGSSVSSAGDVNGDGFADVIIGAFKADPDGKTEAGETYVVFGKSSGWGFSLDLSSLNGSNGFRLDGVDGGDYSGGSVSSAGDVNGDGFDDVIINADFADPDGKSDAGESYVVFGKSGGWGSSLALSSLNGSNGFRLDGVDGGDNSGWSVSSAGDVNGDGFADVIIGAFKADPDGKTEAGESYVVFGKSSGWESSLALSSLNGINGFRLDGVDGGDKSGWSVSSAGDVNGDGFDDVIINANFADPDGKIGAGESYVVFGKRGGWGSSLALSSLDGSNGFRLDGVDAYDWSGYSVSSAGDVNGDGYGDILIGAFYADPDGKTYAGESYVVFGKSGGWGSSLALSSLNGSNGFRLDGVDADDRSGSSVSSAGDVNGDGFDDVIIGAFKADPDSKTEAGETYVVFGGQNGLNASPTYTLSLSGTDSGQFEIDVNNQVKLKDTVTADYETQSSYSVTVTATDSGGLSKSQPFTINVIDQYEAPKNTGGPSVIGLSSNSFAENTPLAFVGQLIISDPDPDDSHTILLSGTDSELFYISSNISSDSVAADAAAVEVGYTDAADQAAQEAAAAESSNASSGFSYTGHSLKWKSTTGADYEAKSSYNITVIAIDSGGLNKSQAFTINVTDVYEAPTNKAPTAIKLSNTTIVENKPLALVGSLSVTDPDAQDNHTLSLSGKDADLFYITSSSTDGDQLKLQSSAGADYETQSSYSVTVTATDSGGLSVSQDFIIGVTDVVENKPPTAINLSNVSIAENDAGGVVGALSVTDPDTDDTHTLSLSGSHGWLFEVSNNQLKLRSGVSADYDTQSSYSVTVTATDSGGLSNNQTFTITVLDVVENKTPTAINLSNVSIAENDAGAVVGTLSVTDPDTDDTHTLTLSGYHSGLFEVSNNQLKLRSGVSADYDTQSSYSVTVTATDSGGLSKSQDFIIGVTDVVENTAPTAINLSNVSIAENDAGGVVGALSVTDPDTDDTHTLSLSGSHGWLFEVSNNQLKLRSGVSADYEMQSSYSVTVTATDSGGLSKSQDFTIGVTNQNSAPTAITLDSTTVAENAVASHIANISGVDSDQDDLTYSITGGSDAASFEIVNGMLHLAAGVSADYETQSSYSVILTATDLEGLTYNEDFTINVTDVEETLYGTPVNDILDGFSGYDIIDGKGGLDTAKYSVASTEVSFSENDAGQLVIQNSANASLYTGKNASAVESDTLVSMERIQFSDKNYALDLDGSAGVAAKAVITCFGQDSLDSYMSAGLTLADGGSTLDEICELVAGMGYIESIKGISTNSSFVDFIFENVVGRSPNFMESAMYTTYLDDGAYTKGSLLTLAANTSLVDKLLTESAVDLIGVAGSADGEILALQYDIGLG